MATSWLVTAPNKTQVFTNGPQQPITIFNGEQNEIHQPFVKTSTTTGNLNYTTDFAARVRITSVTLFLSAGTTGTVTITLASKAGAAYNAVLSTITLTANTSAAWQPTTDLILSNGDELLVTSTGVAGGTTYGLRVTGEPW